MKVMTKLSKEKRTRNHPQEEEVHAKTAGKEELELKEHTPIHSIEEIKGKRSSREGKNAIKAITKSVWKTSKKWTKKQYKRGAKGRKARVR